MDAGLNLRPFQPFSTIQITADAVTSGGVVATFTAPQDIAAPHIMVVNEGTVEVYMATGIGTAVAAAPTTTPSLGSTPCPPGVVVMYYKGPGANKVSFAAASSTAKVDITAGIGS